MTIDDVLTALGASLGDVMLDFGVVRMLVERGADALLLRQPQQLLGGSHSPEAELAELLARELGDVRASVFVGEGRPRALDAGRVRVPRVQQTNDFVTRPRAQVLHPLPDLLRLAAVHAQLHHLLVH